MSGDGRLVGVDIRRSDLPGVRTAVRRLDRFNRRHPWSHHDHFHRWILRNLPARRRAALDVGCGEGALLLRLAEEFVHVHGTDLDPGMRRAAQDRCATRANVTVGAEQLHELPGPFDLITMVATLHHLDEAAALREVARLLAPGGRLLVVGMAPPVTWRDTVVDLASALANPVMGLVRHPRPVATSTPPAYPMRDPERGFDELRTVVRSVLPGAVMRRRLFFRHTVAWTRPHDPGGLPDATQPRPGHPV